jgi:hypothetical protein
MATSWTFESAVSNVGSSSAAAASTGTVTPNVGDLMVVSAANIAGTTVNTAFAISDSSVGGASWTPIIGVGTNGLAIIRGWYKVANANDNNSGSGITVTATASGGSGTNATYVECDIFRLPAGFAVLGLDIHNETFFTATTTSSFHGSAGSSYSGFTDALAFTALNTDNTNGGLTGTNTFTGTSAATNLALCLTTNDSRLANQYVGGVQASATTNSNTFENTWATSRSGNLFGATFVYAYATNWTFRSAVSAIGSSAAAATTTGTVTPNVGDLLYCSTRSVASTTAGTAFTIADTGANSGWTAVAAMQTSTHLTTQAWWRLATAADTGGITITTTSTGGSSTYTGYIECDVFRLPAGYAVIGIDMAGVATAFSGTSHAWSPSGGSSYSGFADALVITTLSSSNSTAPLTGANTFSSTNSAINLVNGISTNDLALANQYGGGVEGSATAADNLFENTWTQSRVVNLIGATFVYVPAGVFLPFFG